ncbi:MAG: hypothetical protein HWE13_15750 [Gammaproteobacteria bacterium]|nr:hypothetical protein [Gammaproteobacteria bacterium]NVK89592.1 hypothetical protein [Gammaproteobacteria bacterium]
MMKTTNFLCLLVTLLLSAGVYAIGPVTSPGWYYTTIKYSGGTPSFSRAGPFASQDDCNAARSSDTGDGGWQPFDGSADCFYLYENDIPAYNELLEHWNLASGPNTTLPALDADMQSVLAEVNLVIGQHEIQRYRQSLNKVSNFEARRTTNQR